MHKIGPMNFNNNNTATLNVCSYINTQQYRIALINALIVTFYSGSYDYYFIKIVNFGWYDKIHA